MTSSVAAPAGVHLLGYDILVAPALLDTLGDITRRVAPAHRYVIVTDHTVGPLHAAGAARSFGAAPVRTLAVPAGEATKTRETWARLTDDLLALGAGRDTVLIALGGGVIGDLTGFVAATFMRGIPYVQVPTTLLAMIDASIGGKTGVDTPAGKNLVGAFHQPAAVIVDPLVLRTLPDAHRRAGLAEAIKHGVIADAAYVDRLETAADAFADPGGAAMRDVLVRSIEIKSDVVRRDAREGGLRKILNFGHTLGHAIEAESEYRLLHGEAVAIGMTLESALAERIGVAARGTAARVRACVARAGLPTERPPTFAPEHILARTRADKKARAGAVEYALPSRVGAMAGAATEWSVRVSDDDVLAVLR